MNQSPNEKQDPNPDARLWQSDSALINQGEGESSETAKIHRLEDLTELLQDDRYIILGHGTGSAIGEAQAVKSIFDRGLEVKGSKIDANFIELCPSDMEQFKSELDHWPHKASQRIILARFPKKFIADRRRVANRGVEDGIFTVFSIQKIRIKNLRMQ